MTRYAIPEVQPRIHHVLVDFMSTECLDELKRAPKDTNRPKGRK